MRNLRLSFLRPRSLRSASSITLKNTLLNGSNSLISTSPSTGSQAEEKKKIYNWYNCGPTVYENSHLGHARTYLSIDIIYRILTSYFNLPINYALGMTDIDDKIIKKSVETQKDWLSIARECEASYLNDMTRLNIIRPQTILRVTEHIPDIIQYIKRIVENGKGYVTETGVYFDIQSNISSYGKLGNIPTSEESGDAVSTMRGKRDSRDFALWKVVDPSTPHWESPWGPGRPGWHIECSAMTHAYFGPNVDIHSGGIDLRFPHHTNEIAQSEAHNCSCHWVSYWIHTGHLYIDGYKMSKSLKNFITIENYLQGKWSLSTSVLTSDGLHPLYKDPWTAAADLRIFFLQHKYHSTLYLSDVTLQEAANWRMKLENLLQLTHPQNMATQLADLTNSGPDDVRAQRWTAESTELYDRLIQTKQEIHTALSEDFNTPVVLSHLSKLSTLVETYYMHYPLQKKIYSIDPIPAVRAYVVDMITLFGLIVQESKSPQQSSLVRVSIHGSKSLSSGESGGGEGGDHEGPLLSPVIDSLVSFRGDVRMKSLAALKEIKSLKKKTSSSSPSVFSNEQYQELLSSYERAVSGIMSSCDDTRNQLSGGMGIEIHDLHEKTMWKMNPKRKEE